jgi:hypothetical protein
MVMDHDIFTCYKRIPLNTKEVRSFADRAQYFAYHFAYHFAYLSHWQAYWQAACHEVICQLHPSPGSQLAVPNLSQLDAS